MCSDRPQMTPYEAEAWSDLSEYWQRKAERRSLPPSVKKAVDATSAKAKAAANATGGFVRDITPQSVKDFGTVVVDGSLQPTAEAIVGLIQAVTEVVQEYANVQSVLEFHRAQGRDVYTLADLGGLDLEHLDEYTRRMVLKSRAMGFVEGGAMGLVAVVPVGGTVTSIGLDLVIMHALSTAVATRVAYAYGIDPTSEAEREHLDRMLRRVWTAQAPKTGTVKGAADAFHAGAGRVRWSDKFRNDHRIAAAVEDLMKQVGNGNKVPIEKVVSKMPLIGVVTSAGINQAVLGSLTKTSVMYGRTIHLAKKHDLPLPSNLT